MTVIATEGQFSRLSSLIKGSDAPENMRFFSDLVTINDAAGATLTLGTLLGKVTATGKFAVAKAGASDGSQNPVAIYWANNFGVVTDATAVAGTDTKAMALARGKIVVSREALKFDASFDTAAEKQAAYDSLKSVGILVEASF